jgi:hypothetical protein
MASSGDSSLRIFCCKFLTPNGSLFSIVSIVSILSIVAIVAVLIRNLTPSPTALAMTCGSPLVDNAIAPDGFRPHSATGQQGTSPSTVS